MIVNERVTDIGEKVYDNRKDIVRQLWCRVQGQEHTNGGGCGDQEVQEHHQRGYTCQLRQVTAHSQSAQHHSTVIAPPTDPKALRRILAEDRHPDGGLVAGPDPCLCHLIFPTLRHKETV